VTYLEGVYWDLDGTIANTELEAHLPAFNNAFNDLGIGWNWDTDKYIHLLKINGGKNRIAHYSRLNNDYFSDDLIFKIHEKKQFHYLELIKKNFAAKRLTFTKDIKKAISISDIIFICVGTPTKKGSIKVDLSFVYKCAKEILKYSKRKKIIITKSTVPVGTGDEIEKILKKNA